MWPGGAEVRASAVSVLWGFCLVCGRIFCRLAPFLPDERAAATVLAFFVSVVSLTDTPIDIFLPVRLHPHGHLRAFGLVFRVYPKCHLRSDLRAGIPLRMALCIERAGGGWAAPWLVPFFRWSQGRHTRSAALCRTGVLPPNNAQEGWRVFPK